ncbi:MAG: ribonuclease III [Blastocatellia bacterium]
MEKKSKLASLTELEKRVAYEFNSPEILERALTHRSYANEHSTENAKHNEALEFLGDSVLGFIVSFWIFEQFPQLDEGRLSKIKAYLVSSRTLARRAEALGLGQFLRLNRGEEKTGGRFKRTLLADAYEAIIAAIFLDGGLTAANSFVRRELYHDLKKLDIDDLSATDYKSALQEYLQAMNLPGPEYVVVDTFGPEHERIFQIELRLGQDCVAKGTGPAIKVAHQQAAREALTKLKLIKLIN